MAARIYTQYVNSANPATTLSATITSGATSLTLVGTTKVPANPNFTILIDSEFFLVTAINTGTGVCTVAPGQEGSTQAGHTAGANIYHVLTAATIDGIRGDINNYDTTANKPASGLKVGDRFHPTDAPYEYIWNGSSWDTYYRDWKVSLPPSSVTYNNQNSATWDQSKGYGKATFAQINGTGCTYVYFAATPATPYHIVMKFKTNFAIYTNFTNAGIALFESGTTKAAMAGFASTSANSFYRLGRWTDPNTLASFTDGATDNAITTGEIWYRLGNDGTTITYDISYDEGLNWMQIRSEAKTTVFTTAPDKYGLLWNKNNSASPTNDTCTVLVCNVTG